MGGLDGHDRAGLERSWGQILPGELHSRPCSGPSKNGEMNSRLERGPGPALLYGQHAECGLGQNAAKTLVSDLDGPGIGELEGDGLFGRGLARGERAVFE